MKKLILILIPSVAFAVPAPPMDGAYVSKIDGETYCAYVENDGVGANLVTDFGAEYCMPNSKEKGNSYENTNQFRCVVDGATGFSDGFIGTYTSKSLTFTGVSEITYSSGFVEQSDSVFQKKYSFKFDSKGICGFAAKTASREAPDQRIISQASVKQKLKSSVFK